MTTQTKEVLSPKGVKFLLNETITYGQHLELVAIYLDKTQTDSIVTAKADKAGFGFVVTSIDGATEGLYEKFLAMPYPETKPILEAIKAILDPKA